MQMTITEVEQLINSGKYFQARVALETSTYTNDMRSIQLLALALSKTGVPEKALTMLESLHNENPNDPETAGILGGIYKELFKKKRSSELAMQSRETYLKNFSITKSYYTGINSATMSAIVMQGSKGRAIAQEGRAGPRLLNAAAAELWVQVPGSHMVATM
jgi:hypothetical protein